MAYDPDELLDSPIDLSASLAGAGTGAAAGTAVAPGIGTAIGAGIGFLAPIVANLIGNALSAGDRAKAQEYMDQALALYGPDILKAPELAALTPHLGPSAVESVYADPQSVALQRQAAMDLQRMSRPDNLEFRAAMNDAESAANQQANAQQGAIQQRLQARGMGGSGVDFALQQQAGQDAANRSAASGFGAAAEGRRQALQAMKDYGQLSTTMRGQSFDEGVTRGRARDRVAEFNEAGRVAGQQQAYENRLAGANAYAGALGNAANVAGGHATQTQQTFGNIGQGAGQGLGAFAQYMNGLQQPKKKPGEE